MRLIRTAKRSSVRELPSAEKAEAAYWQEARKLMRQGFAALSEDGVALRCMAPAAFGPQTFDLSPDGRTLAVASLYQGAYGADLHLIDVATGVRRPVHSEPANGAQTFVHAVLFAGTGLVYALNNETRHLDPATGETRMLAAFDRPTRFNPFCARPVMDATRRRLVVFDADEHVRVLEDLVPVLALDVSDQPECRAAALSPSGRLLALAHGVNDATVRVWEVGTGRLLHDYAFPFPFESATGGTGINRLGFDPTSRFLVANSAHRDGPFAIPVGGGPIVWTPARPLFGGGWARCHGWAYSPDGALLAIGGRDGAALHLPDGSPAGLTLAPSYTGRTGELAFSADGTLLACFGDTGQLTVHRVPAA